MASLFGFTTLLFLFGQQILHPIGVSAWTTTFFSSSLSSHQPNSNLAKNRIQRNWLLKTSSASMERENSKKVGIIIVDHGSKRQSANDMLLQIVEQYKQFLLGSTTSDDSVLLSSACNDMILEPAHMELAAPSIETAYQRCIEQGANHIIVHPFFLSQGRHVQEDVPHLVRLVAAKYPHITYQITAPLGSLQRELVQLIAQTIDTVAVAANIVDPDVNTKEI